VVQVVELQTDQGCEQDKEKEKDVKVKGKIVPCAYDPYLEGEQSGKHAKPNAL
jgi:hypothetical protein